MTTTERDRVPEGEAASTSSRICDLLHDMPAGARFTSTDLAKTLGVRASVVAASLHRWLDFGLYALIGQRRRRGREGKPSLVYEIVDPTVEFMFRRRKMSDVSRCMPLGVHRPPRAGLPVLDDAGNVIQFPASRPHLAPAISLPPPPEPKTLSDQLLDLAVAAEALARRTLESFTTEELEAELTQRREGSR